MQRKENKCCTPKCTKATNTTLGIFAALGVTTIAVGGYFFGKNLANQACQSVSTTFDSYMTNLVNQTLTNNFTFDFATNLPSEVPINTNLTTPYGPMPVNTTVALNLPSNISVSLLPIITQLSNMMVSSINSFSQSANDRCTEYSPYAIMCMAAVFWLCSVWLISTTFGFGSKHCEHEIRIKELEEVVTDMQNTKEPSKTRSVVL